MPQQISYSDFQIIRKACGSPAVNYIFKQPTLAFSIDNFETGSGIFWNADTTAGTGSIHGYIPPGGNKEFDIRVGTVSIMGSGGGTQIVEVMGLF